MAIQIGFSTSSMFLSKVIRWITKAKYSHTWFAFDMYGQKWILQADIGGVQIDPFEKYAKKWSTIKLVDMPADFDLAPAWAHLSDNYGYATLFGDLWVYLGRWLKRKWNNPFGKTKSEVCSELVALTLQKQNANVLKELKLEPSSVKLMDITSISPEDLDTLLELT